MKEAAARIKINQLLEAAGWRFFADERGPANIQLEVGANLSAHALDALVEEIEAEQALVAANRELIARFERKIKATLARI
jgi:hypothetical protein